jgi:hypothetical protein
MIRCGEKDLRGIYFLLLEAGGRVEVSAAVLEKLGDAVIPSHTVIRSRDGLFFKGTRISEIPADSAAGLPEFPRVAFRLFGLDDLLLHDWQGIFKRLLKFNRDIDFCPGNRYGCASALALEWIKAGGKNITVSFLGKGNCSPLEEILAVLRLGGRFAHGRDLSVLNKKSPPQSGGVF